MPRPMQREIKKVERATQGELFDNTVKMMWEFINRDVKDPIIIERARLLKGSTKDQTIKNTYDYVVSKMPYKLDPPDRERLTAPIHFENGNQIGGDCDDMVMFISALLNANGIKTRIKILAWRIPQFTHVVLEAWNGQRWMDLDATMKYLGYDVRRTKVSRIPNPPVYTSFIKSKIYENPMPSYQIETLSDSFDSQFFNTTSASTLNCGCSSGLSDCACGGTCSKCRKKKSKPDIINNNYNIIPNIIGNDLTSSYSNKQTSNPFASFENKVKENQIAGKAPDLVATSPKEETVFKTQEIPEVEFKQAKTVETSYQPVVELKTKHNQTYQYEVGY